MTATLILVRHGEIVRPQDTSNFDGAPLSARGREEIRFLSNAWPFANPAAMYASPLRRALESADVFRERFAVPTTVRPCLREWAADTSGIPQSDYLALEGRAWADFDFVPPSGESLRMAEVRGRKCLEAIGRAHDGETVAVMGHGTLFSMVTCVSLGVRPTAARKASIGFAHAAVLEAGSSLRVVRGFAGYGIKETDTKPL